MFSAHATEWIANPAFWVKLSLIALAGLNAWTFHRFTFRSVATWDRQRRRAGRRAVLGDRVARALGGRHHLRAPARLSLTPLPAPACSSAELVLLTANAVYGTAYVVMRPAVDAFGPVTLAFLRLAIGFAIVAPLGLGARGAGTASLSGADRRGLFWMGFLGFTLAMALTHWGLAWSTATNAALLVATEPIALVALAPIVLGERLTRREGWGTALALLGATVIVVNGVPGLTVAIAPHWRGDLLLLLSGVCFAAYSCSAVRCSPVTRASGSRRGPSSGASSRRRRSPPSSGRSAGGLPGRRRAWPPCSTWGS